MREKFHTWLYGFFLLGATVAAFSPVLDNGFVNLDDRTNFLKNIHYRGIGPSQWRWSWTTYHLGVYQPLSWMLLGAEYAAWGLDPLGYHAVSLALHVAVALVVYALLALILQRAEPCMPPRSIRAAAALAAGVFALHPLRAEVVAWASCQPYLPCSLTMVLAAIAYVRAQPGGEVPPDRRWLAAALALSTAALLFKAVAVGLPAALLALDIWPLRRIGPGHWLASEAARRAWREKLPWLALSAAIAAVSIDAKASSRTLSAVSDYGVAERLAQASYATWFYLEKTALPTGLTAYYPLPARVTWADPRYWRAAAALLGITAAAIAAAVRGRRPGPLAAWLCYLAVLAPNAGLVRIGQQAAADRYSYAASLPLAALFAYLLLKTLAQRRHILAGAISLALFVSILSISILSWRQCRTWHDSETVWRRVLSCEEGDRAHIHMNLGAALDEDGRPREALSHYVEALRLDPNNPKTHYNLGLALDRLGNFHEAMRQFSRALDFDPEYPQAHYNLGAALARRGRLDEALHHLNKAVANDPDNPDAHNDLGAVLVAQGRTDEAAEEFSKALQIKPSHRAARKGLAEVRRAKRQ